MAPDTAFPREEYTLVIRQYTSGITRLFIGFGEESMTDQSEMLQFSDRIKKLPLQVTQVEGEWIISTQDGIQRALINIKPPVLDRWSELLPDPQETLDLRLYPDGKREIRLAAYDHFSPPRYDALPLAFCKRNGMKERATLSFESKPDECFAGTGERFAKMDLSGQTFFLKNQDGQGVNNRRTYKNIPFYLSSRMYGTFYHTCAHSKLSLAGQSTRSVQFLSDQAMLDVFIIAGNTMEEILRGYRDLTGYPSMPPLWSFGIWMSRMTYFSADEVNEICDRMRAEHYPCDVIHLDTGWFKTDLAVRMEIQRRTLSRSQRVHPRPEEKRIPRIPMATPLRGRKRRTDRRSTQKRLYSSADKETRFGRFQFLRFGLCRNH